MDYPVHRITPDLLKQYWPLVQPELVRLYKKAPAEWIPEDIYADIRHEKSFLFVVFRDNVAKGFYILRNRFPELLLYVVCMLRNTPVEEHFRVLLEGITAIRQLAIEYKYKTVSAYSQRKGAERVFTKYGFKSVEIKFEMKI